MKKLCVSLMALVALLCVSCSNDPEIPEKNDNGIDVTLSITTNPLTKALETNQVGVSAPIDPAKEFIVYFMDESGNTVTAYKLTDTQISAIQPSTVGAGVKFTNLDPSVVSVYVVANVPSGTLPATAPGTSLTDINGKVQNISEQQTANAASVVLANTGKTVKTGFTQGDNASNGNAQFTVAVELTPIVSRIQIKKVSVDTDKTITSFTLAGIYIDNFYQKMTIGGAFTGITDNDIVKATDKTTFAASNALYSTTNLYDEDKTDGLVQDPFVATKPQVYGYQFFPTKKTNATDLSKVPYIILKLTNVKKSDTATRDISEKETYYIAVKAYKTTDATPATITEFLPGQIYTIANIPVSEKNIVTDPTKSLINVTVNVTVAKWTDKALNPDFGY